MAVGLRPHISDEELDAKSAWVLSIYLSSSGIAVLVDAPWGFAEFRVRLYECRRTDAGELSGTIYANRILF
jgi:hypothetical protein